MSKRWIHEGDAFPDGFYIKSGSLYHPNEYKNSHITVTGKDGLVEQVHYRYGPGPFAKPSIHWVTFGYHGKWFRVYIRFVNKPDKIKVYWGILRRPKKNET